MKLNKQERELIEVFRTEKERAKNSGAFSEEQKASEVLMGKMALQSIAEKNYFLHKDNQKAWKNYRNF